MDDFRGKHYWSTSQTSHIDCMTGLSITPPLFSDGGLRISMTNVCCAFSPFVCFSFFLFKKKKTFPADMVKDVPLYGVCYEKQSSVMD